jgi:hypothetical protein
MFIFSLQPAAAKVVEPEVGSEDEDEAETEDVATAEVVELRNNLLTACKVGDVQLLKKVLQLLDADAKTDAETENETRTVNMQLGSDKWTALHIAAQVRNHNTKLFSMKYFVNVLHNFKIC